MCEGLSVDVEVPGSCPPGGCGLVLEIHGLFMNADAIDANTGMRARGRAQGYVVVQPTAPSGRLPQGPAWLDADDDTVWRIVMHASASLKTDPKKLHVTGFSQGGYMTWRLLCKHSDVIASAAPAAAGKAMCTIGDINGSCDFAKDKPQPVPVLFAYGTKDPIVTVACARAERDAVIAAWSLGPKQVLGQDANYERSSYSAGATTLVVLEHGYTTDPLGLLAANAGHCVVGATPMSGTIWDQLACKPPNAFVWGDEVMSFFVNHPRP
jgi:poly(3-hydroxybutyrate) depolymerase